MKNSIRYCNEKNWLNLWHRLGIYSHDKITNAYIELLEHYSEPHRKYHNLEHINHCLIEFDAVQYLAVEPDILELAIWYHDVIYDIGANNNEELSALLVEKVMTNFLSVDLIKKVKNIILATKHIEVPDNFDAKLMLDIDISNIGQAEKFKETNKLVREEYSLIPDNLFANNRSNILQLFLDRPSIYLTEVFQKKYEKSARKNIESSIRDLNKKP
jgi:predicted metal-dependent HD superfamily phosphohydrolase